MADPKVEGVQIKSYEEALSGLNRFKGQTIESTKIEELYQQVKPNLEQKQVWNRLGWWDSFVLGVWTFLHAHARYVSKAQEVAAKILANPSIQEELKILQGLEKYEKNFQELAQQINPKISYTSGADAKNIREKFTVDEKKKLIEKFNQGYVVAEIQLPNLANLYAVKVIMKKEGQEETTWRDADEHLSFNMRKEPGAI